MKLYVATGNQGKLREFSESARGRGLEVLALPGLGTMPEPAEDAATFMGNAELKAKAYSEMTAGNPHLFASWDETAPADAGKVLVLADDSGLEVDALGGQPGVRSARFADDLGFEVGLGSKDERNNRAVLALMAELERAGEGRVSRGARFVCALAVARAGNIVYRAEGVVEGSLLDTPRGENGFGYDPLFFIPEHGRTTAELPREEKWRVSHRGQAFRKLLEQLASTI